MTEQWEYQLAVTPGNTTWDNVEAWLNRLGADGWELVAFDYGGAICKRRKT